MNWTPWNWDVDALGQSWTTARLGKANSGIRSLNGYQIRTQICCWTGSQFGLVEITVRPKRQDKYFALNYSVDDHCPKDTKHTWYLSRVPRVVPVEKNLSCGEIWPHDRFSCGQILHIADRHVDKFLTWQIIMWKKFSTWEMWRKFVMWRNNVSNLWCFVAFYAVLLQNRDLRSFVAISVLSRFTRFCVEKNSAKNYAPWRKND